MTSRPPLRASRSSGEPAADAAAPAARRALAAATACGALGAAAVLVASGRVWAEGTAALPQGEIPVRVTGSEVTALPSALALVGLAALVAVFAVRRTGRTVVAALLALCGAGTAAAALVPAVSADGGGALEEAAAEATGLAGGTVEAVSFGGWPFVAAFGGLLLLAAGALALRHGRSWPAMSGRHERTAGASPAAGGAARPGRRAAAGRSGPGPERPEELWKALDRGEDPTAGDGTDRP
ncbi:TIGR02234 family membrane protein [Streptomyces sp. TRM 70361]|uniref:TIGR02234 family membrane protein n=1 Tax=Streptomyces sp. TRM 70361 TaxID=3116553 RepID=UPI002E7C4152|nr:TIGR02234 family membrane protein [Streptomyces sp. TRM 70361]MEE1942222.1 TIGR02234 family membrane protein [Streptomyces sp. TRM 70361]